MSLIVILTASCSSPSGVQVANNYVKESGFAPLSVLRIMQVSGSRSDNPAHFRIMLKPLLNEGLISTPEADDTVIKDLESVCDFNVPDQVESRWVLMGIGQWKFLPVNSLALKDWNMLVPLTNRVKDCSRIDKQYREWIRKVRLTVKIEGIASESSNTSISQLSFTDRNFLLSGAEEHLNIWNTLRYYEYSANNTEIFTSGEAISDATWSIRLHNLFNTVDDDTSLIISDEIYCNGSQCLDDKLLIQVEDLKDFEAFVGKYASDDVLFTESAEINVFGLSIDKKEYERLSKL